MAAVFVIGACSALVQLPLLAQVRAVEPGTRQGGSPSGSPASNDLMMSMYNQLESLQQEVQTLRGIVEEQSNRLRRLETDTRDRYIDIDYRLNALGSGAAPPPAADAQTGMTANSLAAEQVPAMPPVAPADAEAAATSAAVPGVDPSTSQMSEQDLYRSALNLLLEESKSEESAATFQVYLQRFPNGRLLPNALYWQGEALILLARYSEAQAAFERVMNEFPADAKAAGAMLKIGVVQNLRGNRSEAERLWRELPGRFPDSASEITLARDYLNRP